MARFTQLKATKGSQKWIQKLINEKPDVLNKQLRMKLDMFKDEEIEWHSPKECDNFAEYRDEAFIERLGIKLELHSLKDFWPKRGPQWDALGKSASDKLFRKRELTPTVLLAGEQKGDRGTKTHSL